MKQRIFISVFVVVLICLASGAAPAQTGKYGPMAKLTQSLVNLPRPIRCPFGATERRIIQLADPLIALVDDRVVVDAVASGDVNVLKAELASLGMQQAVAYGQIVSRSTAQSQPSPRQRD